MNTSILTPETPKNTVLWAFFLDIPVKKIDISNENFRIRKFLNNPYFSV